MALCRIYLFTHKRHTLLPRAIQSLLKQTLTDWVCELHNDAPGDPFPGEYIALLNDDRFVIKNHPANLGGTISFNLAFAGCKEKYASILEDDNWWEPDFLQDMTGLMDNNSTIDVAWSNMRIWKEGEENKWTDTGNTVWPLQNDRSFTWSQPQQALGALHSNGAMMYRSANAPAYIIPSEVKFDAIELVRERTFKHPIFLNSKILANFSVTRSSHRQGDNWKWIGCQVMQLSTFIVASGKTKESFDTALRYYRSQNPGTVTNFFLANMLYIRQNSLYNYFTFYDWYIITKWLLKNNTVLFKLKKYLASQTGVYNFILTKTRDRYNESAAG